MAKQLSLFEAEKSDPPEPKSSAADEVRKAVKVIKQFEMSAEDAADAFGGIAKIFRGVLGKSGKSGGAVMSDEIQATPAHAHTALPTLQYVDSAMNSSIGLTREPVAGDIRWVFETDTMEAFDGADWHRIEVLP
ncbi:MAG: hypothetical protein KAJ73_00615 [Zetaproteobacteria bacterium]|nr:hypothetical protein [Zetaproteobacteria bacterium]